jgi:hypothetical protein
VLFIKHRVNDIGANYYKTERIEVDVWGEDLRPGHDGPNGAPLTKELIKNEYIWFHAKDLGAFMRLLQEHAYNFFMHDKEPQAQVSNGQIWTTIPELVDGNTVFMDVKGTAYTPKQILMILHAQEICSDDCETWKRIIDEKR